MPLIIAAVLIIVMLTWLRGSKIMFGRRAQMEGPIDEFVAGLSKKISRVSGAAIYPHGDLSTVPLALRASLTFNRVLHEQVVIISIKNVGIPHVVRDERVVVCDIAGRDQGIFHVVYRVGFNDSADVPWAVRQAVDSEPELTFSPKRAIYMLSVFRIELGNRTEMPRWQKVLFRALERASSNRTQAFHLPLSRTIVAGAATEL